MLYTLQGKIVECGEHFFIIQCGDMGFKAFTNARTLKAVCGEKGEMKFYTFLYIREEQIELYGFLEEEALKLFELLNTVAGIGPKTALGVLDIDSVPNITAAIIEKRSDILTHASGIGRKTAERIILELENKIKVSHARERTKDVDASRDVEEVLVQLGYSRSEVRRAIQKVSSQGESVEDKIKLTLKELGRPRTFH